MIACDHRLMLPCDSVAIDLMMSMRSDHRMSYGSCGLLLATTTLVVVVVESERKWAEECSVYIASGRGLCLV
jgi:hypothetical protein